MQSRNIFYTNAGALAMIVCGIILFCSAFPLLIWNENRAIKQFQHIKAGSGSVISVAADTPDPANEGQLIHITGPTATAEMLSDEMFYVSANAVRLTRNIVMYQWNEHKNSETRVKPDKRKEAVADYSYKREWHTYRIKSETFHDAINHNNLVMLYNGAVYSSPSVSVGGFQLDTALVGKITNFENYPMTPDIYAQINPEYTMFSLNGREFYFGNDPKHPAIGDMRVGFSIVKPGGIISVIGQQSGNTIIPYKTPGGAIAQVNLGDISADVMLGKIELRDIAQTWALRLAAWLMIAIGLRLALTPMKIWAFVGIGKVVSISALCLSLLTIGAAWFSLRPPMAVGLCLSAMFIAVVMVVMVQSLYTRATATENKIPGHLKNIRLRH